ncbi:hypothetical protein BC940DRAFT_140908 [Gongronella butleri]|nr:hypothetical protein BC940DRAFT_140908 [Gongronella butleri]
MDARTGARTTGGRDPAIFGESRPRAGSASSRPKFHTKLWKSGIAHCPICKSNHEDPGRAPFMARRCQYGGESYTRNCQCESEVYIVKGTTTAQPAFCVSKNQKTIGTSSCRVPKNGPSEVHFFPEGHQQVILEWIWSPARAPIESHSQLGKALNAIWAAHWKLFSLPLALSSLKRTPSL